MISLCAFQGQHFEQALLIDKATCQHILGPALQARRHNLAADVVHHDLLVHGVKRMDGREQLTHFSARTFSRIAFFQRLQQVWQLQRQRPPAAVVGTLVEIAVQQIHQQTRQQAVIVQRRRQHRAVERANGLGKYLVGARARLTNLLQHGLQSCVVRLLACRHDLPVPDHTPDGVCRTANRV